MNQGDRAALEKARGIVSHMQKLFPDKMRDTSPASAVGALLTVTLQHCDSILLLMQTKDHNASAEALMRPAIETTLRLTWVTEDQQRAISTTNKVIEFPPFSVLLKTIIEAQDPTLGKLVRTLLNGKTHGGMEQLTKYYGKQDERVAIQEASIPVTAYLFVTLAWLSCGCFCRFKNDSVSLVRLTEQILPLMMGLAPDFATTELDKLKTILQNIDPIPRT